MTYTQNQLADICRVGAGTMTAWRKKGLIAPDATDEKGAIVLYSDAARAIVEGLAVKLHGAITLEARAERIKKLASVIARNVVEVGFELVAAKEQCGHGNWAAWLEENFSWTQQTANNFMRVAERFGKLKNVFQFQPSTLQAMLRLPAGTEQDFIDEQAAVGKPVEKQSAREVKAAVAEYNAAHGHAKKQKPAPVEDLSEVGTTAQIEPSEGDRRGRVTLDVVMATAQKFFDSCATVEAVEVVLQIFQLEAKRRRGQLATELNKQALTAAQVLK